MSDTELGIIKNSNSLKKFMCINSSQIKVGKGKNRIKKNCVKIEEGIFRVSTQSYVIMQLKCGCMLAGT